MIFFPSYLSNTKLHIMPNNIAIKKQLINLINCYFIYIIFILLTARVWYIRRSIIKIMHIPTKEFLEFFFYRGHVSVIAIRFNREYAE